MRFCRMKTYGAVFAVVLGLAAAAAGCAKNTDDLSGTTSGATTEELTLGDASVEEADAVPLAGEPGVQEGVTMPKVSLDRGKIDEIVRLVNEERTKNGLDVLVLDEDMTIAASVRAQEQKSLFSHTRPDGRDAFSIFDDLQIARTYRGENLAYGGSSAGPGAIMNLWMGSEGHRENILQGRFTQIGVGYYESGGYGYWCQLFSN